MYVRLLGIMKRKYPVSSERIERFVRVNEEIREYTAYAEGQFYLNFKDLSLMQAHVLNIINFNRPCTMSQIAKVTSLTMGSVTQIVDKLVSKKYVKRVHSKEDRRIIYAELMAKGKKVIQATQGHVRMVSADILSKFTEKEQEQMLNLFQRMVE